MKTNTKKFWSRVQAILLSLLVLMTVLPIGNVFADDPQDQTANDDIVRSVSLSYQPKGEETYYPMTPPYVITDMTQIDKLCLSVNFQILETENDIGQFVRTVTEGDYFLIDLPAGLILVQPPMQDKVYEDKTGELMANLIYIEDAPDDWKVKVEFVDFVDDPGRYDIEGSFSFCFELSSDLVEEGESEKIYIPIDGDTFIEIDVIHPEPPPTKPTGLTKTVASYDHESRELVWNIRISPDTGIFSGATFSDVIDLANTDLVSVKHGAVTLVQGVDYTLNTATGEIVYLIPEGRDGAAFQDIVITTKVKAKLYETIDSTVISNQAFLTGGADHVDLSSEEVEKEIKPNWLTKSGSAIDGNRIKWTVTANTHKQKLYNGVLTDYFQSDVKLDKSTVKLSNTAITVYDNAHTPLTDTEIYGVYKENLDGTSELKIYFPREIENASTAERVVTFITDVVPPSGGVVTGAPTYSNNVTLVGDIDGGGTGSGPGGNGTVPGGLGVGVEGVAVPHIKVEKTHKALTADDKRNGTIVWTFTASSNLSSYGYSQLVDTLPEGQTFIPGEIYWGTTPIDSTTEPSAVISGDGKTLTITFTTPNALATQQSFTVKAKIDPDVYGEYITNKVFSNTVVGSLYETDLSSDVLASDSDTDTISVTNRVIQKSSSNYSGHTTGEGINPRLIYTITINENLMPLTSVVVRDDFDAIITQFRKTGETSWATVPGVKWHMVPGSLVITKTGGTRDSLDLAAITAGATYVDNLLTVDFGAGVDVNDKYVIKFALELDLTQADIFKENGTIRSRNNKGEIEADGLKPGWNPSPATGNRENQNILLDKTAVLKVAEQQIEWYIRLNQHRIELDNTAVCDVLALGLTLDPTSLKLYKNVIGTDGNFIANNQLASQATEVTGFTYTYELQTDPENEGRYKLTVELPDNQTDYVLVFATDVDRKLLGKTITNQAYFSGTEGELENESSTNVNVFSTSGGSSSTKSHITVSKLSADTGLLIDTATFRLEWLRNGDPDDAVFVRDLQTTDGKVTFWGLTKGEKYQLTEIAAPDGYKMDDPGPHIIEVPDTAGTGPLAPIDFHNSPIKSGSWTPKALKKLDGTGITFGFNFKITDGTDVLLNGTTTTPLLPNGDSVVTFTLASGVLADGVLDFTDDHEFAASDPAGTEHLALTKVFFLSEVAPTVPGYGGYDTAVHTLVLKVYNVKGRAALKVVVEDTAGNVLTDDDGNFKDASLFAFFNTYRASSSGDLQFAGLKNQTGHEIIEGKFTFELYEGTTLLQSVNNTAGAHLGGGVHSANFSFAPITYNQYDVGTKVYTIVERDDSAGGHIYDGYTYDKATYELTVTITDNGDGTLNAVITKIEKHLDGSVETLDIDDPITFVNSYTTTNIHYPVEGIKTLNGRDIEDGQFSFKFEELDSLGTVIYTVGTVTNIGNTVTFGTLAFSQADVGKTFYYRLTEVGTAPPYYSNNEIYYITIKVEDNHDGTLKLIDTVKLGTDPVTDIEFVNNYYATGKTDIHVIKHLKGKPVPDSRFAFTMQQYDIDLGQVVGPVTTVRNNATGTATFPALSYTQADVGKTFYYIVKEVNEHVGGYHYDDETEYMVSIAVYDNGDGTLDVVQTIQEPAGVIAIEFFNIYELLEVPKLPLGGLKTLEGRLLAEGQFTFLLNRVTADGDFIETLESVTNAANGTFAFTTLTYGLADAGNTYYYTITEVDDDLDGYHPDESVYTISVQVIDLDNGTLKLVTNYKKDGDHAESITFENKYITSDVPKKFEGTKTLTGRALADGQFSFLLEKVDADRNVLATIQTVTNVGGTFEFDELVFSQSDIGKTYYYKITEVDEGAPGYTYDTGTEYFLTLTVIDNGNGTLSTVTTIKKNNENDPITTGMTFANKYNATGTATITGTKKLVGKDLPAGQFRFELVLFDTNTYEPISDPVIVTNDASGNFVFPTFNYTEADLGVYNYRITEIDDGVYDSDGFGYTYDGTVYYVEITVTDPGEGELETAVVILTPDGADEVVFNNSYKVDKITLPLSGMKFLDGRVLAADQFEFVLEVSEDGTTYTELQRVTNNATGQFSFDTRVYTQADMGKTYYYRITEVDPEAKGYDPDKSVYTYKVTVVDNNEGAIYLDKTLYKDDNIAEGVVFVNTYEVSAKEITIDGNKTLTGRPLADGQFTFILEKTDSAGNVLEVLDTVTNTATGSFAFTNLVYTQGDIGKIFYYRVTEQDDEMPGYTHYDGRKYMIKVTITDNGDGTLSADVFKLQGTNVVSDIEFANIYEAYGDITIDGEKTLEGKALPNEQFAFELQPYNPDTESVFGEAFQVRNDATGKFVFPTLSYDQDDVGGDFFYRVVEIDEGVGGYTYDTDTEYVIQVIVVDNGDGTLDVSYVIVAPTDAKALSFANIYTVKDENLPLGGEKLLDGRVLEDKQFTFILTSVTEDGEFIQELQRVNNDLEGVFNFADLVFTQAHMDNTYYFTIHEEKVGHDGYFYDGAIYTLVVEVIDNNEGRLILNSVLYKGESLAESVGFTNTYTTTDVEVELDGTKTLTGHALADGQFSFLLEKVDAEGNVLATIQTVKNVGGAFEFANLVFGQADMGNTYYYRITEVDEGAAGYTYDPAKYVLTVSVIDNGDGTLSTELSLSKDNKPAEEVNFANTYTVEDKYLPLGGNKVLDGRVLENEQFTFILNSVTEDGEFIQELQRVNNDLAGVFNFADLLFTQANIANTYYFTIHEEDVGHGGYYYDDALYTLVVEVIDNHDGTMTLNSVLYKGDSVAESVGFSNTYTTTDVEVELDGTKTLTGHALADGQFSFLLEKVDAEGNVLATIQTVKNVGGAFEFANLVFGQADMGNTYYYRITEVDEGAAGYTYDPAKYVLTVSVIDNGDGTLSTELTLQKGDITADTIDFANTYEAKGGHTFSATKVLDGKVLDPNTFTFFLEDGKGNLLQTVMNAADGTVSFAEVVFTQDDVGEHYFKIYEKVEEREYYTFDTSYYMVRLTVTDNGNGTLSIASAIQKVSDEEGTVDASAVEFVNEYYGPEHPDWPQVGDNYLYMYMMLALSALFLFATFRRKRAMA